MTTTTSSSVIDPSIDEMLLLQENQYQMSNLVFNKIKPIGAERKIGQSMMTLPTSIVSEIDFQSKDHEEITNHTFDIESSSSSTKSTLTSIYDHFHFTTLDELDWITYSSCSNYSPSSTLPTSACSTLPSTQSVSHSLDNCIYQRQISTSSPVVHQHQSIWNTGKIRPALDAISPINRFSAPQQYVRNSFWNLSQRIPPNFSVPFQSTRERFQVNSVGRPILRTNTSHHYHHYLKIRR